MRLDEGDCKETPENPKERRCDIGLKGQQGQPEAPRQVKVELGSNIEGDGFRSVSHKV